MNTNRKILGVFIVLLISILMNSCLDYEITTQVYPNGKIERIFKVSGDKDMIYESSSITLPSDSTWEIKTRMEPDTSSSKTSDSVYVYWARKVFKNYKELNKDLKNKPDIYNRLRIDVDFKKKFRWFNTFFTYRETYGKYFPYNYLPSSDFVTEDEIRYCLSDNDDYRYNPETGKFQPLSESDTSIVLTKGDKEKAKKLDKDIQSRFEKWEYKNIFEDYFNALSKTLGEKDKNAYNILVQHKEAFYDSLKLDKIIDIADEEEKMIKMQDSLISGASRFLHISASEIQPSENNSIQNFFDKLGFLNFNIWYTYHNKIIMPGLITNTNSTQLAEENNTWNFSIKDFYATDYVMLVQSKEVNNWTIVISIIVICLLLAGLVIGIIRR